MKGKLKYLLVLISMCGLIASSVGLITNVSGLFFTPIADEFNIMKGSVSLTLTISNIVFAIGGLLAPKMLKEENFKKLIIFGTVCVAGCTALLGLSPNLIIMYVLNAVRGFAGGVLGFVLITMVINNWFQASVGLATSIAMSCSGFAGALFSPIISSIIESSGWRVGYMFVAAMMAILNLPAILFLPSLDPKAKNMVPYGYEGAEQTEETVVENTVSAKKPISPVLFGLAILFAVLTCGGTALPQHFPGIAEGFGLNAAAGAMMLSVCMLVNSIGKIIFGALSDTIGSKKALLLYTALVSASIVGLWMIHVPMIMTICAGVFGLVYSLGAVGPVNVSKDLFGLENYADTYPKISLAGTISNAIFSSLIGFMYDFSGNYTSTLLMMLVMMVLTGVILIRAYKNQ